MFGKTTYHSPGKFTYVRVHLDQQDRTIRFVQLSDAIDPDADFAWTDVADAGELVKKAGKNRPYLVHFTGFGILSRMVENAPNYKDGLLVSGSETDFYFSSSVFPNAIAVSFMRTSVVEDFLDQLRDSKAFIWAIHIGPAILPTILPENSLLESDMTVEKKDGHLKRFERNDGDARKFMRDGRPWPVDLLYADAVLQAALHDPENYVQGLSPEDQAQTRNNYKEYVRFVKLGVGILAFFLITLTANYFYVNHLNDEAAQLESDIAGYGDNLSLIDRLRQEQQRKLVLIENSGIQSSRYLSFYLDEIGASVPGSVQLSQLETFPLEEPLKPKRKVSVNTAKILVSGFSASSKVLDDWIEFLDARNWTTGVELMQYVRLTDKKATFQILIKIDA